MATADVLGSAPVVEPVVDRRAAWARASAVLGGCALVVLVLVPMANLSPRLEGVADPNSVSDEGLTDGEGHDE
jgi:hypothetical protein